jgi:Mn-dependent DtxR family transcriptional regulator
MKKGRILSSAKISKALGISRPTVYKAFREMKEKGFMTFDENVKNSTKKGEGCKFKQLFEYNFFETPKLNPEACENEPTRPVKKINRLKKITGKKIEPETGKKIEPETGKKIEPLYIDIKDNRYSHHRKNDDDDIFSFFHNEEILAAGVEVVEKIDHEHLESCAALFDRREGVEVEDLNAIADMYNPTKSELMKACIAVSQNDRLTLKLAFLKSKTAWKKDEGGRNVFNQASCKQPDAQLSQLEKNLICLQQYKEKCIKNGTWDE